MKTTTTATAAYESPICRVINIDNQELICTSPVGFSNEAYEEGSTLDWFTI
ncbi:MAG: hypothetical protein MJY92_06450 [Bacteroidales bacterium]|nr:hypothetical protein [Bacteroidales bacterium]